ncbi:MULTISPECIES: hypothetical protein [Ruegeria]|uniref:Uncharacterized protein n=1 Tax=Ruegeria denitrificans TaxID=1715692 RepID=A0A0P1IST0_9RHOB|nr:MULTISPECIES: hypothetical protein [Ruegeria]CUK03527.1 hypothetical protein RUE5091_02515 [Ruegeria denitrificans]
MDHWISESIAKINADAHRSADTHLFKLVGQNFWTEIDLIEGASLIQKLDETNLNFEFQSLPIFDKI